MYKGLKMSDPLYDHSKHLDLTHKKAQGILQFGKIGHKRGDDEKRMAKLVEYKVPQDDQLIELLEGDKKKEKEKQA
jgi:hypothetical protein